MDSANDAIEMMNYLKVHLTQLHDGLLAKVLIQRAPGRNGERSSEMDAFKPPETPWTSFLDDLSFLCDFQRGGRTVKAVAVQAKSEINVFWMASNVFSPQDITLAESHLKWILYELYVLSSNGRSRSEVVNEICRESIKLAEDKVQNYLDRLSSLLNPSNIKRRAEWEQVSQLALELRRDVVDPTTDKTDICNRAFRFRRSTCFRAIDNLAQTNIMAARIIHYLGRLGSWTKASRSVTSRVQRFGHILARRDVSILNVNSDPGEKINTDGDIKTIISRATSSSPPQTSLEIIEQKSAGLLAKLQKTKQKPKIHAEAALLYHFHTNNFRFARGESYIGCSKPSCYACALYFRVLGASERRRHGNAWLQWCPPGKLADAAEMAGTMAEMVRDDVRQQLQRNVLGGKRTFDSTTGITGRTAAVML